VDLVTHYNKQYTCTHYSPVLRENVLLTSLAINPLSGEMIEKFYENSHCTACIFFWGLMTIFVSASGPNTPCDVTCRPSFDAI